MGADPRATGARAVARLDPASHRGSAPHAVSRAGDRRQAVCQHRQGRRRRRSPVPRLLHRGFRVAHGGRRGVVQADPFTVSLRADPHWVGFRTGHLLFSFLPALVAWSYQRLLTAGRIGLAGAMTAGVLLAGLPTTAIDAYNAQDVDNLREGPGFRWTLALSPSQWEAVEWIRQATPRDAIVQAEPVSRGRDAWSLIPSFAGRRMAAGLPISLLHEPHYDEASALIRTMFADDDAAQAHRIASRLGVQYVYVDADDRARYPAVGKFDDHPDLFEAVFRNRGGHLCGAVANTGPVLRRAAGRGDHAAAVQRVRRCPCLRGDGRVRRPGRLSHRLAQPVATLRAGRD